MSSDIKQIFRSNLEASFQQTGTRGGIREIHDQLNQMDKEYNSIPESIFVQEFLDMFMNGIGDNVDRLEKWIIVAGNLRFGVHILDDNTKEVLFTVPPLFDTSIVDTNPGHTGESSIAGHLKVYEALVSSRPMIAKRYFEVNMADMLAKKIHKPSSDSWQKYQAMLDRYAGTQPANKAEVKDKGEVKMVFSDDDSI